MSTATEEDLDFFANETEDDLRQQMTWLGEVVGLDHGFFSRMLRVGEDELRDWREGEGTLSLTRIGDLSAFWYTMMRLLSFSHNNHPQMRTWLETLVPHPQPYQILPPGFVPPWTGTTLRAYLELRGRDGFGEVEGWISSFRFGNRY